MILNVLVDSTARLNQMRTAKSAIAVRIDGGTRIQFIVVIIALNYPKSITINKSNLFKEIRSDYGESCTDASQCTYNANLYCVSDTCSCSDPTVAYWNGTYCGKA